MAVVRPFSTRVDNIDGKAQDDATRCIGHSGFTKREAKSRCPSDGYGDASDNASNTERQEETTESDSDRGTPRKEAHHQ